MVSGSSKEAHILIAQSKQQIKSILSTGQNKNKNDNETERERKETWYQACSQ